MATNHYFSAHPQTPSARRQILATLRGQRFVFWTDRGVFARGGVDRGTRLLVETVEVSPGEVVLDWGCGYGAIGIVMARCVPGARVVLIDVNERAVERARENAILNGVPEVEILVSEGFTALAGRQFDVVLSNPPIRAGKRVLQGLIEGAYAHLRPGGRLFLVAQTQQGAKSLRRDLATVFEATETVARKGGYRVLLGCKRDVEAGVGLGPDGPGAGG